MTETKPPPKPSERVKTDTLTVGVRESDDVDFRTAEVLSGPYATNAIALNKFARGTTGDVSLDKLVEAMTANAERVKGGDMRDVEAMLVSQSTALNGLFADLVRRSAVNLNGGYFEAGERYLKLAFKAQNQARMTLESLSTIKNPPLVYAKQANIANGPQQVNNGPVSDARAGEKRDLQNELLEVSHEPTLDPRATGAAGAEHTQMETLDLFNRTENR